MSRSTCRSLAVGLAVLLVFGAAAFAQIPDCGVLQGNLSTELPNFAGSLPPSGDMTNGLGSSHLYVLTQWGFSRAPISSPSNPAPYANIIIGNEGGSGSGGIIPIMCDCHQGSTTMAAAQGPDGQARFISDWQPYDQGGDPGDIGFSGLPAMVAMSQDNGGIQFGQQVDLPDKVAFSGRIAAIYTGSKYFGYFPVHSDGVYMADMTSPTGNPSASSPMPTSFAIGWSSGNTPARARGSRRRRSRSPATPSTSSSVRPRRTRSSTSPRSTRRQAPSMKSPPPRRRASPSRPTWPSSTTASSCSRPRVPGD